MAQGRTPRQDLLQQNIALPAGYVGDIVAPELLVFQKTGTFYYQTPGSNANVVNGRSAGAVVTPSSNTGSPQVFACVERSDRQLVDDSEINTYGGADRYQLALAAAALTSVADLVEAAIAAALFAVSPATVSGSTDFEKILNACDNLKSKRGKLALVGSSTKLRGLRTDSDVQSALQNTGMVPASVDPRFVSNEVLAAACGVSQVVEGLDVLWPADGLAVMILADKAFEPKQLVQSMRAVKCVPSGNQADGLYLCWEGYDTSRKGQFIDVEAFVTPYVLNETLIQIIDGSTASSSSGSGSGA